MHLAEAATTSSHPVDHVLVERAERLLDDWLCAVERIARAAASMKA